MKSKSKLLPKDKIFLAEVGENIKLARLRRKLTIEQVAERAGISRPTLYSVEKGEETTALGTVFRVLKVLGLHLDIGKLALDDSFGRKLQDVELLSKTKSELDVLSSLKSKISSKILVSLLRGYYAKGSYIEKVLGCSYTDFVNYLEDNNYNFKVGDKGLDIDHIIPISSAASEEEVIKLNHHTNLQLLPSYYNRNVKKDNKWDSKNFNKWFNNW